LDQTNLNILPGLSQAHWDYNCPQSDQSSKVFHATSIPLEGEAMREKSSVVVATWQCIELVPGKTAD
jgi:hypothetical protein